MSLLPAISPEALFNKSQIYIKRGLRCKDYNDSEEYQLWASLGLEILGKACLAKIHPSLIVDPTHKISLFAASSVNIGTDIKTITAHTLFDRLSHISPKFNIRVKDFCETLSQRRNSELHSGELPFAAMPLQAWEGKYWHATQIILEKMDSSLDNWLGTDKAKAPREIVEHVRKAFIEAAHVRMEHAKEGFLQLKPKEREKLINSVKTMTEFDFLRAVETTGDAEWLIECPACSATALMSGFQYEEIVSGTTGGDYWEEYVDKFYFADEFKCIVCKLNLNSQDEIEAVGLDPQHVECDVRERSYEPDYGND